MKILTFTTLFPSENRPNHGIFVETRLRELVAHGPVQARVVAPVPWFPFRHPRFGNYAKFAQVPADEIRSGIQVSHPRYLLPPKVGMNVAPMLLSQWSKREIARILDQGYDFDLIDAHYFYPDGVAAAMLGKYFNKPVVITARGSDVNLLPHYRFPRQMILWASRHARAVVTVSNALKNVTVRLGVDPDRVVTLRNGVDLQRFQPVDRESARAALGLDRFTLLSVGNLVPLKGHDLTIKALSALKDVTLLIAGSGPERNRLENLAKELNVLDRVRFLGSVPQTELRTYYSAADIMVLASSREGWANVLLESMACGTPVAATNVSGTPEAVTAPEAGVLIKERTPAGIVNAVTTLRNHYPDRTTTRRHAEKFSWNETTQGQMQLFQRILGKQH